MAGGGIGRHAVHGRKGLTRVVVVHGLDVADAEHVGGVDVRGGIPGSHLL